MENGVRIDMNHNGSVCEIWPPNFFRSLTQNSVPKLKVKIRFYVDSENFMKKYGNPIEFYCLE